MTNEKRPLVYRLKQPTPFSGKELIKLLQTALYEATGEVLRSAYPLDVIEPLFIADEQGQEFWSKDLSINVLEIRLKDNYNIRFHRKDRERISNLFIIIEDIESFKTGFSRLVEDLTDPDKKYLIYHDFIKTYRNMLPYEKIEFFKKKTAEEIARKKSSKK